MESPAQISVCSGRISFYCKSDNSREKVWYHDGQTTGNQVYYEGNLDGFFEKKLYKCNDRIAVAIIYGKK